MTLDQQRLDAVIDQFEQAIKKPTTATSMVSENGDFIQDKLTDGG